MSEFVKTKKEFNKKPFNDNKDIKEGSEFILDIKRLGINGEGIGFYNRLAVFVDGAIPGEGHNVSITKLEGKMAYAKSIEIKTKSEYRDCRKKSLVFGCWKPKHHVLVGG